MARHEIDIDEDSCAEVMRRFGLASQSDAVNFALRRTAPSMTLVEALAMQGTGWDLDLDEIRDGMGAPEL